MDKREQFHSEGRRKCRKLYRVGKILGKALGILLMSSIAYSVVWAEESALLAHFHPYRQGSPRIPGLEPGVTLSRANAQLAREVLPAEVLQLLAAGDVEISIQETTDLPPRPSYIDATLQHSQSVSLNGGYTLQHYQAGAPFPLLDPADPQAGEKLAWNLRYRDLGETLELVPTTREVNASGGVEHSDRGIMRIRFGMHRPNAEANDPQWQERGVFMKNSFELLSPSDREGILNLRIVYDDDGRTTEQWRYSPQNRRTRKDYMNYITPIAGHYEVLQEESPPLLFHGYLHDYRWAFLGAQVMLVPGFAKTTKLRFGGKNGWYPQVPWELRHVLLLACTPQQPHPFGKRVFFLDQQTYTPLLILTYDPAGAFVRLTIPAHAHPSFHPGSNGTRLPVYLGGAAINYARDRATLATAEESAAYNRPLAPQRFELMEILRKGK
ncbi:MAG: DUF1329 domain-containing protein [Deltaproteobacteria bacterium]|nr:DUF1329 domain-containing protein [Deltaproteobacteria bacterium]